MAKRLWRQYRNYNVVANILARATAAALAQQAMMNEQREGQGDAS